MGNIMVSLVTENQKHEIKKIQMKDSHGQVQESVSLALCDYMLSTFKDLASFFEWATENKCIPSKDVTLKIIGEDGKEYPLPFENRDLVFRCSEASCFRGEQKYIVKGEENRMVSEAEFHDFFNEFLGNVISNEGHTVLVNGHFHSEPRFAEILENYHSKSQVEDDIWVSSELRRMEKSKFISYQNPKTIEDYLRIYPIFRDALSFNQKCDELRKQAISKEEKETTIPSIQQHDASYYRQKRSLCFVIGNGCEPLVLETDDPEKLDDYISENFASAKEVRRKYKDLIMDYILKNKEYVIKIRNQINNPSYNGQVTILSHDHDGGFTRLSDGAYMRYPVVYSKTFKDVRKLYVNIDKFKKNYNRLKSEEVRLDNQIISAKARSAYEELEHEMRETVQKLEEEKGVTKQELESVMNQIQTIISDMQDLEQTDYNESLHRSDEHRLFSPYISRMISFTNATNMPTGYKRKLDEWAKQLVNSPYRYDDVRFIMRFLRRKKSDMIENGEDVFIPFPDTVDAATIRSINSTYVIPTQEEEQEESILHPEELKEMYPEGVPADIEKGNIHVHHHL